MKKLTVWNKSPIEGPVLITYKVDGVRMLRDQFANPVSKSGKPLYNLTEIPPHILDAEVFCGDWASSISFVRTQAAMPLDPSWIYPLSEDQLDSRLLVRECEGLSVLEINEELSKAVHLGYEGLVLRTGSSWIKVKPTESHDVVVTGLIEGTGKYEGSLGALVTAYGKVGTGFTDTERQELFTSKLIGQIVEVECMSLTPNGKFRHPRFTRLRWDKEKV